MARILIVEDNVPVAQVFGEALQGAGHDVSFSTSANEAIAAQIDAAPDLVLMDMSLERSNGMTASLALRGAGYDGPILLVTGGLVPFDREMYERARISVELRKPIALEALVAEVEKYLTRVT